MSYESDVVVVVDACGSRAAEAVRSVSLQVAARRNAYMIGATCAEDVWG